MAFAEEGLIAVDHDDLHAGPSEDRDVRETPLERDRAARNGSRAFGKNEQVAALLDRLGATIQELVGVEIVADEVGPFDHAAQEEVARQLVLDDALNARVGRHQYDDVEQGRVVGDDQAATTLGERGAIVEFDAANP